MKHLVYITANLVNGKQYVGDHSTENINDSYKGSGLLILRAIKKYGKENFEREILEICESKQEAFNKQEKYINFFNTLKPIGYNISPKGGHNVKNCFSEESKRKISESLKKTYKEKPELIENLREKATGRILSEEVKLTLKGRKSHRKGLSLVEEYGNESEKIRKKLKKPKTKEHKEKISKSKKGIRMKDETKKKIKISLKGRKTSSSSFGKGLDNPNGKLSDINKTDIKTRLSNKEKVKDIAKDYKVSLTTIYGLKI